VNAAKSALKACHILKPLETMSVATPVSKMEAGKKASTQEFIETSRSSKLSNNSWDKAPTFVQKMSAFPVSAIDSIQCLISFLES